MRYRKKRMFVGPVSLVIAVTSLQCSSAVRHGAQDTASSTSSSRASSSMRGLLQQNDDAIPTRLHIAEFDTLPEITPICPEGFGCPGTIVTVEDMSRVIPLDGSSAPDLQPTVTRRVNEDDEAEIVFSGAQPEIPATQVPVTNVTGAGYAVNGFHSTEGFTNTPGVVRSILYPPAMNRRFVMADPAASPDVFYSVLLMSNFTIAVPDSTFVNLTNSQLRDYFEVEFRDASVCFGNSACTPYGQAALVDIGFVVGSFAPLKCFGAEDDQDGGGDRFRRVWLPVIICVVLLPIIALCAAAVFWQRRKQHKAAALKHQQDPRFDEHRVRNVDTGAAVAAAQVRPPLAGGHRAVEVPRGGCTVTPGGAPAGAHMAHGGYDVSPPAALPMPPRRAAMVSLQLTSNSGGAGTPEASGAGASGSGAAPLVADAGGGSAAAGPSPAAGAYPPASQTLNGPLPNTLAQPDAKTRLEVALENMAAKAPHDPFLRRYDILTEHDGGGQSVVAFARDRTASLREVAIKFFVRPGEFEEEAALYRHPILSKALPAVIQGSPNSDGAARSASGFVFPPYLIVERGVTLDKWLAQQPRNLGEVATMLNGMAELLHGLHSANLVHRDIKPANTLYMPSKSSWKLLDVGIVARAGEVGPPRCTLAYAPPEVVAAYSNDTDVTASAAHDIWALGVMAFEAIVGRRALDSLDMLFDCASGKAQYPWDASLLHQAPERWRRSRLRPLIEPCLARDPMHRLVAADIVTRVERLWLQSSQ